MARCVKREMRNAELTRTTSVAVVALFLVLSGHVALAAERAWTRSEILTIADAEAKRLGYDLEHLSTSFDVYNSKWEAYRAAMSIGATARSEQLKDRTYWAVYYGMKFATGDGLFVFIDRTTGDVITSLTHLAGE